MSQDHEGQSLLTTTMTFMILLFHLHHQCMSKCVLQCTRCK